MKECPSTVKSWQVSWIVDSIQSLAAWGLKAACPVPPFEQADVPPQIVWRIPVTMA